MKKLYSLLQFVVIVSAVQSQPLINISGTQVTIKPATIFSMGGIALLPSSTFSLTNMQLNRNTTLSNPAANNYVSRVYKFSANTIPYSGTIMFHYNDSELNGLQESGLQVNIHDGYTWNAITTASNDVTSNYVLTTTINNQILNELALAHMFSTLPTIWDIASASRQGNFINVKWEISQEQHIDYYSVQRSVDGYNWISIGNNIPATNLNSKHSYSIIDYDYVKSHIYYRVKQMDLDGEIIYSKVMNLGALQATENLIIYPNPAQDVFYLNETLYTSIKSVQLYNNVGARIKIWSTPALSYKINELPSGIYHVLIISKDGASTWISLNKRNKN